MKPEDLNPILRWWFRLRGQELTPQYLEHLENRYWIFAKKFTWDFYWGALGGVAFVVFIVAFDLWLYLAPLFITLMLLIWFVPLKRNE